jgi:Ser/Thr protein kinase RdoA (MazF antagonist)
MMNLEIMRLLVAEAEAGSETGPRAMPVAGAAAARWGLDPGSLQAWCYSSNAIYLFRQAGQERVLRLAHNGDRNRDRNRGLIQAELDLVVYLAGQGVPAAQPIPSQAGRLIEDVDSPYGRFCAVVFERVPGQPCEANDMDETLLRRWGQMMAHIHNASERFVPSPGVRRPAWQENLHTAETWLPHEEQAARRLLGEASDWLQGLPVEASTYGLIHYDLEPDNLIWDGQQLHVVDFDDAAYYWFAADVAFALDHVLSDLPQRAQQIQDTFLEGYRSVRPLATWWESALPRFNKLLRVLKFARVLHAYRPATAAPAPALDPPWLASLRARHRAWLDSLRATFAEPF